MADSNNNPQTVDLTNDLPVFPSFPANGQMLVKNPESNTLGYSPTQFILPKTAYNKTNGCLVKTKIGATLSEFFVVDITGNSNYGDYPIHTIVNFYNFNSENRIVSPKAINYGYDFGEIKVFNKDGYVYLWFKQKINYTFFSITAITQNSIGNVIDTVISAEMPTEGVTRLVTITPTQVAFKNGAINGSNIENATIPNSKLSETSTLNVGSADKLTSKQLTNEDLNNIKDSKFSYYYAYGNTCANKPGYVTYFGLQVFETGSGYRCQILTTYDGVIYKRFFSGSSSSWSAWKKMLTEDDITSLKTRIAALEAQLNG